MPSLYEKYRPQSLAQVVGHPSAVKKIQAITSREWGARAWFISGPSGVGKTTLARIIAAMGAGKWFIEEVDFARDITPARVRQMCGTLRMSAWTEGEQKTGRAIIINEAHGLRTDAIECFLTALEDLPRHGVVIFTTTKAGQEQLFAECIDTHPLLSRCTPLELTLEGVEKEFPAYAKAIAAKEGLDGRPFEDYVALCQRERFNLRAIFQAIESGIMLDSSETITAPSSNPLQLSAARKATLTRWGLGGLLDKTA